MEVADTLKVIVAEVLLVITSPPPTALLVLFPCDEAFVSVVGLEVGNGNRGIPENVGSGLFSYRLQKESMDSIVASASVRVHEAWMHDFMVVVIAGEQRQERLKREQGASPVVGARHEAYGGG